MEFRCCLCVVQITGKKKKLLNKIQLLAQRNKLCRNQVQVKIKETLLLFQPYIANSTQ